MLEENRLICPVNYSARTGDVELVQYYGSVDIRKYLELGVAGDQFVVWTGLKGYIFLILLHLLSCTFMSIVFFLCV